MKWICPLSYGLRRWLQTLHMLTIIMKYSDSRTFKGLLHQNSKTFKALVFKDFSGPEKMTFFSRTFKAMWQPCTELEWTMYAWLAWLAKMSETLVLSWGSLNIWRMICSIGVIPTHSSAIDYCHQLTSDKRNFINSKVGIWTGLKTITILHKELHWLNVHERTNLVWWCTGICVTGLLGSSLITSS